MSAVPNAREAQLAPMDAAHLGPVIEVEHQAYTHPWTHANFIDSMHAGYHCRCLIGPAPAFPDASATPWEAAEGERAPVVPLRAALAVVGQPLPAESDVLLGYFVAMLGVEEVHLLNLTVAPAFQRQGWAPLMLEALGIWARSQRAQWLWLEVRTSNRRAQDLYLRYGFRRVGMRKGYYPAAGGQREDAIVMSLRLDESPSAWGGLNPS